MKNKCVVWIETGVSIELPNDVHIESEQGNELLKLLAFKKFKESMEKDQLDITWEKLS